MASKGPRKTDSGFFLSGAPSHMMRRCVQRANDRFSRELGSSGLTRQQFTVLAAVEEKEGLSQAELVEKTGIDRSTLAEMVSRMTLRGLLARKRTEQDARANAVYLGPLARKALRGAKAANERVEKDILSGLPAAERTKFSKYLATIVAHLERGSPNGRGGRRLR
ncbi:MAG: MarR family winged helix-turn-helix transcriptional regulator [Alphaproteobacteria bacterium]